MPGAKAFPVGLLDWAGHRAGGVKRLFYEKSGRPSGEAIRTKLLDRLGAWASTVVSGAANAPRVVLLVGGPGNGKTEAVEQTVHALDYALGVNGAFESLLRDQFLSRGNAPPPRIATTDVAQLTSGRVDREISIVQDASVADAKHSLK